MEREKRSIRGQRKDGAHSHARARTLAHTYTNAHEYAIPGIWEVEAAGSRVVGLSGDKVSLRPAWLTLCRAGLGM